jgi:hypothetical protein
MRNKFKFNLFKNQLLILLTLFFIILFKTCNTTIILDYLNWFILGFIICHIFYYSSLFIQILFIPVVYYGMQLINFLLVSKKKFNVIII